MESKAAAAAAKAAAAEPGPWGYHSRMIDIALLCIDELSREEREAFLRQLIDAEIEIRVISEKLHLLSVTGELPELVISGKDTEFDLDLEFVHTVDPSILDPLRERLFELMTPPWEGCTTDHLQWRKGGPI